MTDVVPNIAKRFPMFFGLFLIGLLVGLIARDDSYMRATWIKSYLKMHSSLTLGNNVSRLFVIHDNFSALAALMMVQPSILSVEKSKFSNVAYIDLKGSEKPVIQMLQKLPYVRFVARNQIIFFCH